MFQHAGNVIIQVSNVLKHVNCMLKHTGNVIIQVNNVLKHVNCMLKKLAKG